MHNYDETERHLISLHRKSQTVKNTSNWDIHRIEESVFTVVSNEFRNISISSRFKKLVINFQVLLFFFYSKLELSAV